MGGKWTGGQLFQLLPEQGIVVLESKVEAQVCICSNMFPSQDHTSCTFHEDSGHQIHARGAHF